MLGHWLKKATRPQAICNIAQGWCKGASLELWGEVISQPPLDAPSLKGSEDSCLCHRQLKTKSPESKPKEKYAGADTKNHATWLSQDQAPGFSLTALHKDCLDSKCLVAAFATQDLEACCAAYRSQDHLK